MKVVKESTNECFTGSKGALDNSLLIEKDWLSTDRIYEELPSTNMSTAYLPAEEKNTVDK